VLDDPGPGLRSSEELRHEFATRAGRVDSHQEAAGATQPTNFVLSHERASLYVTAPAVDDVTKSQPVTFQTIGVRLCDACDARDDDPVVTDIDGHDDWRT
jgi:hypothetical protein